MTDAPDVAADVSAAIQAYTAAYLRLEGTIPSFSALGIAGLRHIHYGRPKAGISHEVIAGTTTPETVIDIIERLPELADAFVSLFTLREDAAEPAFTAAGYTRVLHNYLMRCDVSAASASSDTSIVQLTTAAELERLDELREDGQILPDYLADPAIRVYALVVDDIPAASAILLEPSGDLAVIEYVYTLETYRRRGYGRWLMRALHREAAHLGAHSVILSSNNSGKPLYESLGYELLCYEDVYAQEPLPPPPPKGYPARRGEGETYVGTVGHI